MSKSESHAHFLPCLGIYSFQVHIESFPFHSRCAIARRLVELCDLRRRLECIAVVGALS